MSIEKLDGRAYKVRWRDSAGKQRSKTVNLWRDAITLDGEMKRKKAMGELITHERGKETLEDFWTIYWKRHALVYLTPRTRENYQHLWCKHVEPRLGRTQLRRLTREQIADLVAGLSLAPASVRAVLAVLQSVLQHAVDWEYIGTNPVRGVRRPKLVKQRESRALMSTDVEAIRAELDIRGSTIVAVLAGTGIRPGELRALLWNHVAHDRLYVLAAVSSDTIGPTKTNRQRSVYGTERAEHALFEWCLAQGRPRHGLVFPGRAGGIWTDDGWRSWQRQVFAPAAARAGLKGVVPYDLRHTFASQRIAEGADILTLASQLGHSPMMTLTVYGHLMGKSVPSECPAEHSTG